MPKLLDPESKIRLVLDGDVGKSPEPAFFSRPLSVASFRRTVECLQGVAENAADSKNAAAVFDFLRERITGWENMIDPETGERLQFSHEKLEEILALDEAVELVSKISAGGRLSTDERKKSESLHSSETDKPASPAVFVASM